MILTFPLSITRSFLLYTRQTCMYCCVYSEKLLVMDRGTLRIMQSFIPKINLRNKCIWLVLLQEFISMRGHLNVKYVFCVFS